MKNRGFSLLTVIVIILLTAVASAFATGTILNNNYKGTSGLTYTEVMNDEELSEFLSVYSTIISQFYDDVDKTGMINSAIDAMNEYEGTSKTELLETATTAMLEYLGDDYTEFMNDTEAGDLQDKLTGKYQGIGVTIQGQTILGVTSNSPAERSGILTGDVIIKVDETEINEENSGIISYLIKDDEKETVLVTILRNEEVIEFNITKEELDSSVLHQMIVDTNIGYINVEIFSETVGNAFNNALTSLESGTMENLIIDLRYNTGGYLKGAEDIAELFLEKGDLIYSLENSEGKEYTRDSTSESRDYNIVVLINEDSASASEILAAALRDSYGATIVGTKSYGKGKVQQTIVTSSGAAAKYTSAKWYTPNDICIDGIGIEPDYNIELEVIKDAEGNIIDVIDSQLNKAIALLTEGA